VIVRHRYGIIVASALALSSSASPAWAQDGEEPPSPFVDDEAESETRITVTVEQGPAEDEPNEPSAEERPAPAPPPPASEPSPPPGYAEQDPAPEPAREPGRGQPAPQRREIRSGELRYMPYRDGMELPPGATIVGRRKTALWVSGAVLFGVSYLITVGSWSVANEVRGEVEGQETVIPVVGPFIRLARVGDTARKVPLAVAGLLQGAGLAMFIGGMIQRDYVAYYALGGGRRLSVLPSVGPGSVGVTATVW
jgi:hypothetical protein